jgi:hypothetical protein
MDTVNQLLDRINNPEDQKASGMETHSERMVKVTVAELAEAIKKNPNHQVALSYKKGIQGFAPTHTLIVEAIDLKALLEDKEVIPTRTTKDGRVIVKKVLAPKGTTDEPTSTLPDED